MLCAVQRGRYGLDYAIFKFDLDGLITEADVKLAANLSSLEEVWVLFP